MVGVCILDPTLYISYSTLLYDILVTLLYRILYSVAVAHVVVVGLGTCQRFVTLVRTN